MGKILILKTNNSIEVKDYPQQGFNDSLTALQEAVCGYIQPLDFSRIGLTMVVNEEGKLNNFPVNPVATYFFWREYGTNDQIVGDVAFLSNDTNAVGDPNGLTDQQVADLITDINWRLEEIEQFEFDRRLDRNEYLTLKGEL